MKQVMELERKIDAVPSRAELAQYQRRFVELNEQVDTCGWDGIWIWMGYAVVRFPNPHYVMGWGTFKSVGESD